MRLNYYRINKPLLEERRASEGFINDLKGIDKDLDVAWNRVSGRWEIYRYSQGTYHWILEIENKDGTYRPLDNRTIKKLWEIDIIARYGSVANFERHLDEKQKKYQETCQKEIDHELKWDLKDDRKLWQEAAENFKRGIINSPPKVQDGKLLSCPK